MSNKAALRELQTRLAQRMQASREQQTQPANWLAVECAGVGLLFSLKQAAEIFTPVPLKAVPYSQPWLAGVANLRGGLFTVVDLGVFLGLRGAQEPSSHTSRGDAAQMRFVSLNPDMNINCALLVDRLVGLRSEDQLVAEPPDPAAGARPRFAGPRMRDASGHAWQQLDLDALSKHEQFLRIVV